MLVKFHAAEFEAQWQQQMTNGFTSEQHGWISSAAQQSHSEKYVNQGWLYRFF